MSSTEIGGRIPPPDVLRALSERQREGFRVAVGNRSNERISCLMANASRISCVRSSGPVIGDTRRSRLLNAIPLHDRESGAPREIGTPLNRVGGATCMIPGAGMGHVRGGPPVLFFFSGVQGRSGLFGGDVSASIHGLFTRVRSSRGCTRPSSEGELHVARVLEHREVVPPGTPRRRGSRKKRFLDMADPHALFVADAPACGNSFISELGHSLHSVW